MQWQQLHRRHRLTPLGTTRTTTMDCHNRPREVLVRGWGVGFHFIATNWFYWQGGVFGQSAAKEFPRMALLLSVSAPTSSTTSTPSVIMSNNSRSCLLTTILWCHPCPAQVVLVLVWGILVVLCSVVQQK